jgi:hypothetical protein
MMLMMPLLAVTPLVLMPLTAVSVIPWPASRVPVETRLPVVAVRLRLPAVAVARPTVLVLPVVRLTVRSLGAVMDVAGVDAADCNQAGLAAAGDQVQRTGVESDNCGHRPESPGYLPQ